MAIKFYDLKVKDVIRETSDTVSIIFDLPENLKDIFQYKPGQYLTIKVPVDDKNNRRAYSLSSSPISGEEMTVAVKKVDNGLVSTYLNEKVKAGDLLEVMPPLGNFYTKLEDKRNYVLYAAGSGITPLISILKSSLLHNNESKILLIYTNRRVDSIIYYKELKELEAKYPNRLHVIYTLTEFDETWNGLRGRINAIMISDLLNKFAKDFYQDAEHFMCGPQGMMKEVENALEVKKIKKENIRKESFTAPSATELGDKPLESAHGKLVARNMKVKIYGNTLDLTVEPDETITMALQRIGEEPPVSCQIGACSTCIGKVKSGQVSMDEREGLTDTEIEMGFVLTCQAHPTTDNCFVDFDI